MKKYKSVLIITYVLLVLGLGLGVASATEDWFVNPNLVYEQSIFSTPYAISVDCVPDGSQCLAAVYAEGVTNQIALYSSTDDWQTPTPFPIATIPIDYSSERSLMNYWNDTPMQLPLGVKYNPSDGLYYIMTSEKVYSFDLVTLTEIYDHSDIEIIGGYDSKFLGLVNNNEPQVAVLFGLSGSKCLASIWLYNGSTVRTFGNFRSSTGSLFDGYGFILENSAGSFIRYARWGTNPSYVIDNTGYLLSRFPYSYNKNTNQLRYLNETGIIYRTLTSDFSTLSGITDEYNYDITTSNITGYGVKENDEDLLFYYVNDTTTNKAYFYKQPLHQTYVLGFYYDVTSGLPRILNISATIECFNTTYSDSGSEYLTISHICEDYNLTVYSSTQYRPVSFTIEEGIKDGCTNNQIVTTFIKKFNYTVAVFDSVTQTPISGATVELGTQTKTTNSNGEAVFEILPLNNVVMNKILNYTCGSEYEAYADSVKTYTLKITKSGYTTYFEPAIEPAEFVGNEIEYDDYLPINMRPVGGEVIVKLRDINGVQIENPDLSSTTQIETNDTVYIFNDITNEYDIVGKSSGGMPVQFYIVSNQSTFNVTVNFNYLNYTDSKIVTLEQDDIKTIFFRLNTSVTNMECNNNIDCVDSFCNGNYYYKLAGCIGGVCEYGTPEQCTGGCDIEIGCYEQKLSQTCESRYDCPNNCSSNFVSYTGLCASDGYCVQIKDICNIPCPNDPTRGCNATTGICCESRNCYEQGFELYFFQLGYAYTTGIIPHPETVTVTDTSFTCGIENQGDRFCISGGDIPIYVGGSKTSMVYTPSDWQYRVATTEYQFYDVSVRCSANCNASIEYCPNGCNTITGYCYSTPIDDQEVVTRYGINIYQPLPIIEDSINQSEFQESGLGFLLLLATPLFIVSILGIVIGVLVGYYSKDPILAISSMVILLVVFSLLQLYPIWIPLVIIIVAGLFFSKMFTNLINRGG